MITSTLFAKFKNKDVRLFTLENEVLKVEVLNYGCIIKSIIYKPLQRETVLGLPTLDAYHKQKAYIGALVGRVGNRIHKGHFTLNKVPYQLPLNGPHHLHGGPDGYDTRIFDCEINNDQLICRLISEDGDQGYPGKVNLLITYHLEKNSLILSFNGTSDKDTLFDPTQHTYFNLNKDQINPILNHTLKLNSKLLYMIEEDGCTGEHTLKTPETSFDFSDPKQISKAMDFDHPQVRLAKGIDHYYLKHNQNEPLFCELSVDDLRLEVRSDLPGAHIYTGNYLSPIKGYDLSFMRENGGICFETQHVPNSINFDLDQAPILIAETPYQHTATYTYVLGGTYEHKNI
ncbi:MAG: galactose mutarotase [Erysipelotrichaceae bacterium]|nr:galactose mutarotase [Erysipelotrichaceae bacterium]